MKRVNFLLLLVALMACSTVTSASEIYHWVDENGVHHYSQNAPANASAPVNTMTVEDTRPSGYDPEEDIYDVAGQAERMAAMRQEMADRREKERERQQRLAELQARQPIIVNQNRTPLPWWGGRPVYPIQPIEPPPIAVPYSTATLGPSGGDY